MAELKDVGGLLVRSIIELQELQTKVAPIDDNDQSIGVAITEIEHKLHTVSGLLAEED